MPQIRHYEMKDSGVEWIGEMPSHWQIQKAKYYITVTNGSDPVTEGEIPVYGSGSKSFRTCGEYKEGPTVLVGRKGSIDKPRYVTGRYWNVDTAFDVKTKGFDLRLYYYLATCFDYQFYMSQTTLPSMTQTNYRNMFLPVPPLSEQAAIAAYLDKKCATIDAIVSEAKASIEEYKSWKASVIFEAVTKGLDPNAEMKDSGVEWIGLIPGHWVVKRLKYVAVSLSKGNGITKDETAEDGDTPCVRYGEIYAKYNQSFMECQARTYKDIITSPKYFTYGDILITCTGELVEEIGKSVAYLGSEKCLAGGDIIVLKHTQNASFLNYALNCNYAQSQKSCDKAKLKVVHISAYDVGNIWMALPPLPEQTAIASYLDSKCAAIDSVIAEKEALISDLETYKRSLIFEVVTGKRRVC